MSCAQFRLLPLIVLLGAGSALMGAGPVPLAAQAQDPTPVPRFEVASVKPSAGPTGERGQPGGRYLATRTVKFFIADAFFFGTPLQMSRVIGGPDWIESALYEINAQANTPWQRSPDGPPRELFLMIRSLLMDRFKLKTHIETRELPVFELVRARADGSLGPQLRQSTVDCDALIAAGGPPPRQPNEPPPCGPNSNPSEQRWRIWNWNRRDIPILTRPPIARSDSRGFGQACRVRFWKTRVVPSMPAARWCAASIS